MILEIRWVHLHTFNIGRVVVGMGVVVEVVAVMWRAVVVVLACVTWCVGCVATVATSCG